MIFMEIGEQVKGKCSICKKDFEWGLNIGGTEICRECSKKHAKKEITKMIKTAKYKPLH